MSASPSLRVALDNINDSLGEPKKVLFSSGSLLAEYEDCSPAVVDMKLAAMGAQIEQEIDIPHQNGQTLIRVGRLERVMFHVQVEAESGVGIARLFPPPGDDGPSDIWQLSRQMADAAFDTTGDRQQALISYVSAKLMEDPEQGRRLASDLSRVISDYLRTPAAAIGSADQGAGQPGR